MMNKSYEIKFYETDCKNRLKEAVLLNFLQDIAADDAEKIGLGYSKIKDKNVGWFLTKYHIKIFKTLKNEGKITLKTESKGHMKITCIRDFDIFDANDEKIGEATSSWVLADLATGKVLLPTEFFGEIPVADRQNLRSLFPKIQSPTKTDYEKTFKATFHDLDVNNHVNNAVYLTWADDTLPYETLLSTRIEELEIQYKQQVKYDETVIVKVDYNPENQTYIEELTTESGETVCIIKQKRTNTL